MNCSGNFVPSIRNQANLITFISSNDFDYLIGQLKSQLYAKSNILTRKLLVVPGDEPLRMYERNCLEDPSCGINFGYRTVNLNLAIETLYRTLNRKSRFPKRKALEFALLESIEEKLKETCKGFEEIKNYLNKQNHTFSFFKRLAENFTAYALYGIKEDFDDALYWQKQLYDELKALFDWPVEVLLAKDLDLLSLAGFEIHIFGFSILPPLYLEFFKRISTIVPIYFYMPMVSKELSLDFISDRAQVFLENESDPLEKNPLLANFQSGLKPYLQFLIDESSYQREAFFLEKSLVLNLDQNRKELLSLKQAFTLSLLEARVLKDLEKQKVQFVDDLLVFQSPNLSREIETMIVFFKEKIAKGFVKLEEIVVISPNLEEYSPLLAYHFEKNQFKYFIDVKKALAEEDLEPIILLKAALSRYSLYDLLKILTCKGIFKNLGIEEKEVFAIKKVIESSSITFAYDKSHRQSILKECDPEDLYIGTIQHFFDQIYISGVFSSEQLDLLEFGNNRRSFDPHFLQSLGKFHYVLEQMNLFRLEIAENKLALKDWIKKAFEFFSLFFDESTCLDLAKSFQEELSVSRDVPIEGRFFYEICLEKLESKKMAISSRGESRIYCTPCLEGVYLGKKLIWILGADDESLPKIFEKNSLDIVDQEKMPTLMQTQKALFLQMIGLNFPILVFSYSTVGADHKEKILSLFVQKILQYVDYYFIGENQEIPSQKIVKMINDYTFSPEQFHQGHFDKYGFLQYLSLKKKKEEPLCVQISKEIKEVELVDIKDLELLLKNPIRFFVQKSLQIYFPYIDEKKEFHLPHFQRIQILQKSLEKNIELFFSQLKFSGIFPQYGFSAIFLKNLKIECMNFQNELKKQNLDPLSGRKIFLKKERKIFEENKKNVIKGPSIQINLDCGKSVQIVGSLQEASRGVFFAPLLLDQENLFKYWPKILAYNHCSKLLNEEHNFLLTLDLKRKKVNLQSAEKHLKELVDYYFLAKENLSFFYADTIKKFLQEDDGLEKIQPILLDKMQNDEYLRLFTIKDLNCNLFVNSIHLIRASFDRWFKEES